MDVWRKIDAPEYVDKRKSSAEILALLDEFLSPNTCSVEKQNVKREDEPNEEVFRYRQHAAMGQIPQSSENENVSLNIKIE
ncbi:unnamed protein product [Larinioides sclopetarius]|uniref:Uncharacterized protein n=1 Tax=Larinioides sclopetarius TaxID=280406 RepID=A0AAV2B2X3_9ARAC